MNLEQFITKTRIHKGWSADKKYQVIDQMGKKFLLRLSSLETWERKKCEYTWINKLASIPISMSQPLELGICNQEVAMLYSWIDGIEVKQVLTELALQRQHELGYQAGEILRNIHSIQAPVTIEKWEQRFNRKMDRKIQQVKESNTSIQGEQSILRYLNDHRYLLKGRPQCLQHGDFHVGNMMLQDNQLVIIDFDRFDFGDPWEEFNRIVYSVQCSPQFASGIIQGYFRQEPPLQFFKCMKLYSYTNMLSLVVWAKQFQNEAVETMLYQAQQIQSWYKDSENPIPSWFNPIEI